MLGMSAVGQSAIGTWNDPRIHRESGNITSVTASPLTADEDTSATDNANITSVSATPLTSTETAIANTDGTITSVTASALTATETAIANTTGNITTVSATPLEALAFAPTAYPVDHPNVIFTALRLRLENASAKSQSPFTFDEQIIQHQGQRWRGEFEIGPQVGNDAGRWMSFLAKLRGKFGTFRLGDSRRSSPRGAASTTGTISDVANQPYFWFKGAADHDIGISSFSYSSSSLSSLTVEAWINTSGTDGDAVAGFDRSEYWRMGVNSNAGSPGELTFSIADGGTISDLTSDVVVDDNHWHHVAVTFDSGTLDFYIDGVNEKTVTGLSSSFGTGTTRFGFVGNDSEASSANGSKNSINFDGYIDDFRLWSTVRTQTEIQNNMHTHLGGSETGLEVYYKLDGGSGTTATDSANSNDGTINGGQWVNRDARSLMTHGWSTSTTNLFREGDLIEIEDTGELKKLVEDIDSNAGGGAELIFEPIIRNQPTQGTNIITSNPKGVFRLQSNDAGWSEQDFRTRLSVRFIEDVSAN